MSLKKGRWTDEDREWLKKNANRLKDGELAAHLNRSVESIKEAKNRLGFKKTRLDFEQKFEQSHQWQLLNEELNPEEIDFFTAEFSHLIGQFQGDILPIEENQLFMVVKVGVMMHRNMKDKKTAQEQLLKASKMYQDLLRNIQGAATEDEKDRLEKLRNHIAGIETANKVRTTEWTSLSKTYQDLLKDLKVTRNQRLEKATGKNTMLDILKHLDDRKNRDKEAEFLEIAKKGRNKEFKKLTSYHTYADGEMEKPILSVESIEDVWAAGLFRPDVQSMAQEGVCARWLYL